MAWDRIIGVTGGARARHDEDFGRVEDLVGVREHRVGGAGKGGLLPDVDQAPGFMSGLDLGNRDQGCLGGVELRLEDEAGQEGHARNLDDGVGGEIGDRAGDPEPIFAGCRLGGGTGDLFLKDPGVARFVVADLDNPLVGMRRIAGRFENGLVEGLYPELIKGEDGPFCTEEILEEEIVGSCSAITCGKDWLGVIARKGRRGAIVAGVIGRLGGNWSKSGIIEDLARARWRGRW